MTRRVACISAAAAAALLLETGAMAQQPISRLKGRVTTEGGDPIPNAEVRAEAFHGYAAGTFAGQRTFSTTTDAKGEWNILGVKSGIWLFEVIPPGQLPESVALPIQRDFDTASRAFDAARSRTHDRNEQRFLSAAVGDLATIKVR